MDLVIGMVIGLVLGALLTFVVFVARAGSPAAVFDGMAIAGKARQDPTFAARLQELLTGKQDTQPDAPSGEPLRLLSILQNEARLIDFLLEDISATTDAQIGQAVREIHRKAQAALREHLVIEPILSGNEGETTTVAAGYHPSAIRVVGHVAGSPPYTGTIQHPGWRVKELKLTPPPEGVDLFVLQAAEVYVPEPPKNT